jgi:hypothetical protein
MGTEQQPAPTLLQDPFQILLLTDEIFFFSQCSRAHPTGQLHQNPEGLCSPGLHEVPGRGTKLLSQQFKGGGKE